MFIKNKYYYVDIIKYFTNAFEILEKYFGSIPEVFEKYLRKISEFIWETFEKYSRGISEAFEKYIGDIEEICWNIYVMKRLRKLQNTRGKHKMKTRRIPSRGAPIPLYSSSTSIYSCGHMHTYINKDTRRTRCRF